MRNKVLLPLAIAVVLVGVVACSLAFASTQRADCPGKIECPLTGELVCRDKCPLADTSDDTMAPKPSCCQGSK